MVHNPLIVVDNNGDLGSLYTKGVEKNRNDAGTEKPDSLPMQVLLVFNKGQQYYGALSK
ncbi:hypothetical protein CHS0354_032656, partial [Potamilus streckersoni]